MIRKKLLLAALISALAILAACSRGRPQPPVGFPGFPIDDIGIAGTVLVVYSTFTYDFASPIIELFEETHGASVELHIGGTGPTINRLIAEASSPRGDILWGGDMLALTPHAHLFEAFTSVNEPYMLPSQQNTCGVFTRFTVNPVVLLVNPSLLGDIEIRGLACLLNPALRGRIAISYPNGSGGGLYHLVNMLYAMGGSNPHAGWDFVEQLVINTGGFMLQNPAAIHEAVASGVFTVGLTCEEKALAHFNGDNAVELVHINEGSFAAQAVVAMVQGARNPEAAEIFIDFVTSYEVQAFVGTSLQARPARGDVPSAGVPGREIYWLSADAAYILEHRNAWIERFWDLWMAHN